jgi:murein DD-endopeptidase MepM/ murein hydrolase activator NlpD
MRRRGIQIGISILLGVMLIFCQMAPGQASDLQKKKDELSKVNRQIEEQKKQLNDNQKKQKDILQELNTIDQDISQTSKDLERIDGELSTLQQSIEQTEKQLQKKEEALQERTEFFHQRLRDIYMKGNLSYLEVLLDSTSMSDFLTRFDYLKRIANQDSKLVKELAAERDGVARQKRELVAKKEEAVVLKRTTAAKQTYLASRKQDRKDTIKNLQSDQAACQRAIQELEATSRQITQIIQQYQSSKPSNPSNPAPPKGTGRFIWPANGSISGKGGEYGMRKHPITGVYKLHDGIDIGAAAGTPVWAADGGTVIHAGWLGAYGTTVIIDHGGGITTLYAHLSSYSVSRGSSVSQGQVIGRVGSTGMSTGPHLHFGVYINGNPTNPMGYF